MTKNYGLIIEPLSPEDWSFGSSGLGMEVRVSDGNWTPFLPTAEKQRRGATETMACVSFSALNDIEVEFKYVIDTKKIAVEDLLWLQDKGYMDENGLPDFNDAFIATLSGTTTNGNSPKRVAEAIHKYGLVPERLRPYRDGMTWNHFYSKTWITQALDLGQEFLKRFPINYEFVSGGMKEYNEARKRNPVQVFVHAYNGVSNGIYLRTTAGINHAVLNHNKDTVLDTYEPFIKSMASNFIYMSYGVRYIVQFREVEATIMRLLRKKNTQEVFLEIGGERYWIKDAEDFNLLKRTQPIEKIEWENVEEVDDFDIPYNGKIIGSASFVDVLKQLFGKIK